MKKTIYRLLILSLILLNTSCPFYGGDDGFIQTSAYEPVILEREAFENSTELVDDQSIETSGKIYVKDNYLIINEPRKGFHIYDNTNPENPTKIKFLRVLGSSDLSIKGNMIYANNARDLIALSIDEDFKNVTVTKRLQNVFPELLSPDGFYGYASNSQVIIDWKLKN